MNDARLKKKKKRKEEGKKEAPRTQSTRQQQTKVTNYCSLATWRLYKRFINSSRTDRPTHHGNYKAS